MASDSTVITMRRVDPDGEEHRTFRGHLHDLVGPFHSGRERPKSSLREDSIVLIAETASAVQIGSVSIKVLDPGTPLSKHLPQDVKIGEIKRMVVLQEWQSSGVGKKLLDAIENIARAELGLQCIVLETLHTLEPAKRFYEKNGYRKRDLYGLYHSDDSQCFEKWL